MKKIIYLFFLLLITRNIINGATIETTGGGGDWSVASTWDGGIIPGSGDDVVVNEGDSLIVSDIRSCQTINITYGTNASHLRIPSGGHLTVSSTSTSQIVPGAAPPYDFSLIVSGQLNANNLSILPDVAGANFSLIVNGTMTVTNAFQILHASTGNNCKSTIDIGSSGSFTSKDFTFIATTAIGDTLVMTQNGSFNATRLFQSNISEDCDVSIDINNRTLFNVLNSQTVYDNSKFRMNIVDTFLVNGYVRLRANSTALQSDHVINMDNPGAYMRMAYFHLTTNGSLISTPGNASTVEQVASGAGIVVLVSNNIRYHHLRLNVSGASGVRFRGGTLDTAHLFGNLTVSSITTLTLEDNDSKVPRALGVSGNLINNGTIVDKGAGVTVNGDINNNYIFYNDGSDFDVGGNFNNSGSFITFSPADRFDIAGNLNNTGTFQAGIDTLDIAGNFTNSAAYVSVGNNIFLEGDWNNSSTYLQTDGDILYFDGTAPQSITGTNNFQHMVVDNTSSVTISSGNVNIESMLEVPNGTLNTNGNMVFLSTIDGTAALADMTGGGTINGNVTVQRFLDEGTGWYLLASPVTGATLADWNNEMPMSGFVGSDEATHPFISVYSYDESTRGAAPANLRDSGYVAASNITDPLVPGEGWFVYFAQVKPGRTAKTVNTTGPLQTGTVNLNLSYTNLPPNEVQEGGWHMLGNPYASPVDWNLVSKTNIENNTAYVMGSGGNYLDVVNDGIDNIYSSEAFWVHLNGAAGSLTFEESDKLVISDDYNAKKSPSPYHLPLKMELTIASDPNYVDYSVLRFHNDTSFSEGFDEHPDADSRKIGHTLGTYPNIASYSNTDNSDIYYNTLSATAENYTIPVRIWKRFPNGTPETFTITFKGIEDWQLDNKCLILWDSVTNITQKLEPGSEEYTFTATDDLSTPRIFLTYSTPLEVSHNDASCFGSDDGFATVDGDGNGNHTYTWIDDNGNQIQLDKDINGPSTANNLAPGTYTVWVSRNGECGTVAATISIGEPDSIVAEFSSDADTVYLNANTTINFTNASINASSYYWDFGDGNSSALENPTHTYMTGGTYEVTMVASEFDCSDTLTKTVLVVDNVGIVELDNNQDLIKVYQQFGQTFVEFDLAEAQDAVITMSDMIGRDVIEPLKLSEVKNRRIQLDLPSDLVGIYTVSVLTGNRKLSKKLYFADR